jgi:hypothetical protein
MSANKRRQKPSERLVRGAETAGPDCFVEVAETASKHDVRGARSARQNLTFVQVGTSENHCRIPNPAAFGNALQISRHLIEPYNRRAKSSALSSTSSSARLPLPQSNFCPLISDWPAIVTAPAESSAMSNCTVPPSEKKSRDNCAST